MSDVLAIGDDGRLHRWHDSRDGVCERKCDRVRAENVVPHAGNAAKCGGCWAGDEIQERLKV